MKTRLWTVGGLSLAVALLALAGLSRGDGARGGNGLSSVDRSIARNAQGMLDEGRRIFRFDTFGDEAFWGDALQLHQALQGEALGEANTKAIADTVPHQTRTPEGSHTLIR